MPSSSPSSRPTNSLQSWDRSGTLASPRESCVSKLIDRIISDRLYDLADSNGWFSSLQAGFCKGRDVKDQILRLVQRISDGVQRMEKSLLVMLKLSEAYDTIWHQRLLHTLLNLGVPGSYVLWLSS